MARHSARLGARLPSARRPLGWTLIEVVVVLAVVGIIAAIGSRLMAGMFDSYFAARDITNSDAQARVAFERMTRELRLIRSTAATDLDPASTAQFRFFDSDGNGVCYYRVAATNQLMRSADGPLTACGTTSAQPLSDFVTGLTFAYYINDGRATTATPGSVYYITVRVDLQDNDVSETLRATIHPRNF